MHANCFSCVAKIACFALMSTVSVCLPREASAQQAFISVNGNVSLDTGSFDASTHTASTGTVSTSLTETGNSPLGDDEADLKASASFGNLHTFAHSTTDHIANVAELGTFSQSVAQAQSQLDDYLTVTSDNLPNGSPCQLKFNMIVDGTLNATSSQYITHAVVDADFYVGESGGTQQRQRYSQEVGYQPYTIADPFVLFDAKVGDQISIIGDLTSVAVSNPGRILDIESATADYSDTANFYVDPLTSGVSLVSASGHDYSSPAPVPEASTCLSFGGLLLGLGGMMLRARKRSSG